MQNKSIWLDNYKDNNVKELNQDLTLDVLIIGGGITGISMLYNLRKSKLKIALVEKDLIGHSTTGHTTGKINYLQELIYYDLEKKYNLDVAKLYLESQLIAIKQIINTIKKEKIDCNLEKVTSYVYTDKQGDIDKLKREKEILESFNIKVKEHKNINLPLKSLYTISVNDTYVFHPIKYLKSLKDICLHNNKEIYEKTNIISIKKENDYYICNTAKYKIKTKKIILACHYPFFLIPYLFPIKTNIEKSYITASLSNHLKDTYITSSIPTTSIRFHQDKKSYLIYLSTSSKICNNLNEKDNFNKVMNETQELKLKPTYLWKNDDILTVDKLPYIGYIKNNDNTLLIGTGYNTWGMTNGTLAGLILSDFINNKQNKYANLCSPLRVSLTDMGSIISNLYYSTKGFVQNKIIKNKDWYPGFIKIENGIATYNDGENTYKVYNKCPHMGCSLIFNEVDKTWDCPCHASRFNLEGKCIKGPSTYDISCNKEFKYNNFTIK